MKLDGFSLAATTNDLTREVDARGAADIIEFRMDSAEDPIGQLSKYDGSLPIIATNRTKWFGGEANDTGRLDRLSAASRFDFVEYVDIELETARGMGWILDEFRQNDVNLIVSHHDFDDTPNQEVLDAIIEQCAQYGDIAKVATFPNTLDDVLRLLKAIYTASNDGLDVAGIAMGGMGSHSRIIAPLYGSRLGYAPLADDTSEYAPGQIPVRKLAALIETVEVASEDVTELESLTKKLSEQQTIA